VCFGVGDSSIYSIRWYYEGLPSAVWTATRTIRWQSQYLDVLMSKHQSASMNETPKCLSRYIDTFQLITDPQHIPDTDPNGNPRGFAIRFLLSADEHKHTDIIAHSTPFFPTRTGEGFLALLRAIGDGSIGSFLEANPSAAAFVQAPKPNPVSFATEQFFGVNAFTLLAAGGERTNVRYRIVPEAGVETLSEEEVKGKSESYLFDELSERLAGSATIGFKLLAQVAEAGDPTDDATKHWPEGREVVELGRVELKEVLSEEESKALQKRVIFDPIPRVEGVEATDDPLLDVRAAVYLISGKGRRAAEVE
jgi:catalase